MQESICNHILALLKVFTDEGHSGTTAPYTIDLFKKLAMFEPIVPLTGEDWEWADVSDVAGRPWYQNKRCGRVFKDETGTYDSEGKVFSQPKVTEYLRSIIPGLNLTDFRKLKSTRVLLEALRQKQEMITGMIYDITTGHAGREAFRVLQSTADPCQLRVGEEAVCGKVPTKRPDLIALFQ